MNPLRTQQTFSAKLLWPADAPSRDCGGFLVGWNLRMTSCVALVTSPEVGLASLESALQILASDPELAEVWTRCGTPPVVLGVWKGHSRARDRAAVALKKQRANFWVTVSPGPSLLDGSVYCCGFPYKAASTQIIFYHRPCTNSYLSTTPFTADLCSYARDESHPSPNVPQTETELDAILHQINCASKLSELLEDALPYGPVRDVPHSQSEVGGGSDSDDSVLPFGGVMKQHRRMGSVELARAKHIGSDVLWTEEYYGVSRNRSDEMPTPPRPWSVLVYALLAPFQIALGLLLFLLLLLSKLLNTKVPGGGVLKDRSAVAQQLDWRLNEIWRWPYQWMRTRGRWRNDAFASAAFVSFWGSVSQVVVDLLLGVLAGVALYAYGPQFLALIHTGGQFLHMEVLVESTIWLMGLPAGMKLNENLGHTLGSMVLYAMELWNSLTTVLTTLEPLILKCVSITGVMGLSMSVALAIDILTLTTLHIGLIHAAFARLYSLSLGAFFALFKLFRGKKNNILRQRIDSCSYDMDQLLLGTLLFTTIFFLFPTIGIYYVFFTLVYLLVTSVHASLWLLLASLNYFPFFAVLLYMFDPGRLPGGIWFEHTPSSDACVYLTLRNRAVSPSALLCQYTRMLCVLMQHYSPVKALGLVLSGTNNFTSPTLYTSNRNYTPTFIDLWMFIRVYWSPAV